MKIKGKKKKKQINKECHPKKQNLTILKFKSIKNKGLSGLSLS